MATGLLATPDVTVLQLTKPKKQTRIQHYPQLISSNSCNFTCFSSKFRCPPHARLFSHFSDCGRQPANGYYVMACLSSSASSVPSTSSASTRLYVSGLSFRTTEESLRNAFQQFGQLVEVNLVMDKIANRPRGFAFLRYATEQESKKAIEGMHGKFLEGRVIFVEVAKPRSQVQKNKLSSR